MSDDLVKRLRDTPNWMREGFQDWKDNVRTYDSAPFEAADRVEELEARLAKAVEALRGWIDVANAEGMPVPLSDLEAAELKGQDDG